MINKRLINFVPDAICHIRKNVIFQLIGLFFNICFMMNISFFISGVINKTLYKNDIMLHILMAIICITIKVSMVYFANLESYLASKSVKNILRGKIYDKVINLGSRYTKKLSSAELLQMSVEGVEQLETYFANFLPQFFYSMISPLILFVVISFISLKVAVILFICVPLIPISIVLVQKFAKKLLSKYWGEYLGLGDSFLENLQGLNTLKIYNSDEFKHNEMNKKAERFRVVTMKVLSMQLNSIIIMDIVAYGGAALGIIFALNEFNLGNITIFGMLLIMLLSADFFLPLRILGSFFHIAMNGIAASKKIFTLLDIEELFLKTKEINDFDIKVSNLSFSYDENQILDNVSINILKNEFVSIVGKSGSGKSTIAGLLTGINENYTGEATIGGVEISEISKESLAKNITLVSANSYIFKGTVRENLYMSKNNATEIEMWQALDKVNLSDFLKNENGLDTYLLEKGSNFSGGQCQRLALARALLHDSKIYIFDEATSNIDADSENEIMNVIQELAKTKTIILISHRLLNVVDSNRIYLIKDGKITESGTHNELLINKKHYSDLWHTQQNLEKMEGITNG